MTRALLAAGIALWAAAAHAESLVGLARVIDGDTLIVAGEHVRLAGIDAPEMGQKCRRNGSEYDCGTVSTSVLREWVMFWNRQDMPIHCDITGYDRYGRSVGVCSAPTAPNIGGAMVYNGYAVRYPKFDPGGRYIEAEDEARREKRGLWAGTFEMPWIWRHQSRAYPHP